MSRTLKIFLIILLSYYVTYNTCYAQVGSYYSLNGIGMPVQTHNVRSASMGGIYNSLIDSSRINYQNPSSYAAFSLTNFNFTGEFNSNSIANQNVNGRLNNVNFNSISIGFPIKEGAIGLAVGLYPYTYMQYDTFNKETIGDDKQNVDVGVRGKGGYSAAFLGLGFKVIDNLFFGFNMSYLFGRIEKSRYLYFNAPNVYNSKTFLSINASGLLLDYGLSYSLNLDDTKKLILSYSSEISTKIKAEEDLVSGTYITVNDNELMVDTVSSVHDHNNSFRIPFKHAIGFMYDYRSQFRLGLDLSFQDWSNIHYKPFNEIAESLVYLKGQQLSNSYKIAIGAEYIPSSQSSSKYYEKIEYRAGVNFEKLNLNVNNNGVYAISFRTGVGLPIARQILNNSIYNLSYLNIGIGFTRQGNLAKNLVQENYISIYLGFNMSNRWFLQRKYD